MAGLFLMATAGLLSTGAEVPQQMLVKLRDGGSISIGLDPGSPESYDFDFYTIHNMEDGGDAAGATLMLFIDEYSFEVENIEKYSFLTPSGIDRPDIPADARHVVFTDGVTLTVAPCDAGDLRIFGLDGVSRPVRISRDADKAIVDISTLACGIYLLRIGDITIKFSKK